MPGQQGNSGGKKGRSGRKRKFDEAELEQLLNQAWPKKERLAALKKFAQRANAGDLESFKLLMAYGYGKPKEKHEISGPGGGSVPVFVTDAITKIYGGGSK
jgi:phosphopantetheinyl transferase